MNLDALRGKKIAIVGADLDLAHFLEREKISYSQDPPRLEDFELIFRSPLIPFYTTALQRAAKKGAMITSMTRLFLELCPAKVIGITGSNGKSITAALLYSILESGYLGGKVYQANLTDLVKMEPDDLAIMELSSSELQDLNISPQIALLLNVTPDHLDHHSSFGEHQAAKLHILAHQKEGDTVLAYGDNPDVIRMASYSLGRVYTYRIHTPQRDSAWVAEVKDKEVLFIQLGKSIESFEIGERCYQSHTSLENIVPATLLAAILGVDIPHIKKAVLAFQGMPHCLQPVGKYKEVEFVDDSLADNPEATLSALKSYPGRRLHLILGGRDKELDYAQLMAAAANCVTVSLLPGSAFKPLQKALKQAGVKPTQILTNFRDPVMQTVLSGIVPHLRPGDIVLLSPSTDCDIPFASREALGDAFIKAIKERFKV